jgi:hypothetical protein
LPSVVLLLVASSHAEFTPPVVLKVATAGTGKIYYIDRGHANIKVGNRLNVYRVLKINVGKGATQSHRLLLGIMLTPTLNPESVPENSYQTRLPRE